MITLKWNGEYWYEDRTPLWNRIASWLLWIGGTRQSPTPVSILGHRVTVYDWGASARLPNGDSLVVSWCGVARERRWRSEPAEMYISPNGTPGKAHTWFIGAPRDVRELATSRAGRRAVGGTWVPDRRVEVSS